MEFQFKLKNGKAMTNIGQREIAFDPESLEIRPILYRVYSGHVPDRGTVQGVNVGDVVVSLVWDKDGEVYKIYKYGIDTLPRVDQYHIGRAIWEKYDWIDDWMQPVSRSETIIPKEVIPEFDYLSNKIKLVRMKNTIERFGLPYHENDFLDSRKQDLKFNPRKLDLDLDEYLAVFNCITKDNLDIDQQEAFFGSNGNGSKAVGLTIYPTYTDVHPDWERVTPCKPGVNCWDKWKFIVRVKKGLIISEGVSHGMSLDIWINPDWNKMNFNPTKVMA
jgi:hypothetical protein